MTHPLTAAWLSAVLLVATAAPLAAETPAEPKPGASKPDESRPDESKPGEPTPGGGTSGDARVERQRNNAAKLAGMVRFVDASCPQAKPDYDRFKRVIAALGVDIKDLEGGALMARSLGYTQAYQKDGPASCERALALFGEAGTAVPGLILRKTP